MTSGAVSDVERGAALLPVERDRDDAGVGVDDDRPPERVGDRREVELLADEQRVADRAPARTCRRGRVLRASTSSPARRATRRRRRARGRRRPRPSTSVVSSLTIVIIRQARLDPENRSRTHLPMLASEFLGLRATHNPLRWYLEVVPGICTDDQFLFGGCGLGAAIEALERTTGRPVVWATAQYLSFAHPPEIVDIDVTVAVAGHQTTQARAVAHVGDREILTVNAALGARDGGYDGQWARFPDVPRARRLPAAPADHARRRLDHAAARDAPRRAAATWLPLDGEPDDGHSGALGPLPGGPRGVGGRRSRSSATSCRSASARRWASSSAATASTTRCGSCTLVPTEWVLVDMRVHAVAHGFGHGLVHLWAEDGTLLATASQSCVVRPRTRAARECLGQGVLGQEAGGDLGGVLPLAADGERHLVVGVGGHRGRHRVGDAHRVRGRGHLAEHEHRVVGRLESLVVAQQHRVGGDDAAAGEQHRDVDRAAPQRALRVAGPSGSMPTTFANFMPYVRCDVSPRHSGRVGHSGGAPIVRRGATFARSDTVRKPNFFAVLRVTKKPLTSTAGAGGAHRDARALQLGDERGVGLGAVRGRGAAEVGEQRALVVGVGVVGAGLERRERDLGGSHRVGEGDVRTPAGQGLALHLREHLRAGEVLRRHVRARSAAHPPARPRRTSRPRPR